MLVAVMIDCSLARCTFEDLPQQALMELLISQLSNPAILTEGYKIVKDDFCTWKGVKCEDQIATRIAWGSRLPKEHGKIDLRYTPSSVRGLILFRNRLEGLLVVNTLPRVLEKLDITGNQFHGSLQLSDLPNRIDQVEAGQNNLSGSLDLTSLPDSLKDLSVNENEFSGTIDLTQLPNSIIKLQMQINQLSGTVNLSNLPPQIRKMNLSKNSFDGPIDLRDLPHSLQFLCLQRNLFTGAIDLTLLSPEFSASVDLSKNRFFGVVKVREELCAHVYLTGNNNLQVVDQDGNTFKSRFIH